MRHLCIQQHLTGGILQCLKHKPSVIRLVMEGTRSSLFFLTMLASREHLITAARSLGAWNPIVQE